MANVSTPGQYSFLDQLQALFGQGDNGTTSNAGMTVPTAYNTSSNWVPPGTPASVGAGASNGLGAGLGFNVGTGQLALAGLGGLAGVLGASKQNKLAQDQFKFQKEFANINLNNSIKSYNTSLEDRLTARGVAQGDSSAAVQDKIDRNRLSR
jgi:hypothetical protein